MYYVVATTCPETFLKVEKARVDRCSCINVCFLEDLIHTGIFKKDQKGQILRSNRKTPGAQFRGWPTLALRLGAGGNVSAGLNLIHLVGTMRRLFGDVVEVIGLELSVQKMVERSCSFPLCVW